MTDTAFLLVILALGIAFFILFHRMKRRSSERHPGRKNPIEYWLRGKPKDDEEH